MICSNPSFLVHTIGIIAPVSMGFVEEKRSSLRKLLLLLRAMTVVGLFPQGQKEGMEAFHQHKHLEMKRDGLPVSP